ncbi:hypothetical protein [Acinetobacter bereziniae]|nr:hypothetical protein [Acinetobacter bereziniae]
MKTKDKAKLAIVALKEYLKLMTQLHSYGKALLGISMDTKHTSSGDL